MKSKNPLRTTPRWIVLAGALLTLLRVVMHPTFVWAHLMAESVVNPVEIILEEGFSGSSVVVTVNGRTEIDKNDLPKFTVTGYAYSKSIEISGGTAHIEVLVQSSGRQVTATASFDAMAVRQVRILVNEAGELEIHPETEPKGYQ